MKKFVYTLIAALATVCAYAAAPNSSGTYYQNANGKKGSALKTALCGIIYNRTEKSYDYLWTAFQTTDVRSDGKIWDMYSDNTNYVPGGSAQGANYSAEGDSYNREHSWPKSWFGGEVMPMYTDLHHMYPTDGYVNNKRANYPFGETNGNSYTSHNNFSKLGTCTYSGYSGTVFEPADEYKGDFARTYFYMVTCYEEKLHDWYTNYSSTDVVHVIDGNKYPGFQSWQLNMLLKWAKDDPVSEKEVARNNAVYGIQYNRNPFIDYPGLEQYIWGSKKGDTFSYDNYVQPTTWSTEYNSGSGSDVPDAWERVTSIQTLFDGGTFIMGYEATAKSGTIIPLRSKDSNATTGANGYFNSGTTANSSTNGTITMSNLTGVTTSDYEVYITGIKVTENAQQVYKYINIQRNNSSGNYYGATSGGTTSNKARLYTSGNTNATNLLPEWSSETDNQFKLTANVSGNYKYLAYNTGSPRFAFYSSAGENIVFYKSTVSALSVKTAPTKLNYKVGETLDLTGLVLDATIGGNHVDVTTGYTAKIGGTTVTSGTTVLNSVGAQTVTFIYGSQTTTQAFHVGELKSIAITTAPTKTTYYEGQTFDPTGMAVTATFSDSEETPTVWTEDVTAACTFDPDTETALETSDTEVTVSYEWNNVTKTADQAITVTLIPTHTAHFSINGTIDNNNNSTVAEGAAISFPADPAAISGKSFMGWTTATIDGTTNTAPSFVNTATATMGNSDITYYAVFADVSGTTPANMVINTSTANFPTSYGTANTFAEYTLNGKKFQIQQGYINGTNLQWRASGNASGTGTMYNSDAINKIQSIVLLYASDDSNKNFTVKVGTSANPTSSSAITPSVSQQNTSEYTFNCSSGNYDYFVLTNGSGAGYLTSITINYLDETITYSKYCTTVAAVVTPTVTITPADGFTNDLANETNVVAGTLTASVTYNDAAVEGASVTWESNNTSVATVNATTGAVTLIAKGTAKITASYAGNSDYAAASAEYDLTVINSYDEGQRNNPYTVAEAIYAIDNNGDVTEVYVAGIVSQVDSYNSTYHSITYWISDDGTTTNQFEVYGGLSFDGGTAFSSINDIQVGDKVVVKGNITYYSKNSVYEFSVNSHLVSHKLEVSVTDAGYATYASDHALDFTDSSIKAYIAEAKGTTGVTFTQVNKIPAGAGVLLYKAGGATEYIPVTTESTDDMGANVFVRGTGETVASVSGNLHNYILNKVNNVVGFYKANGQTVATNRAYIQVSEAAVKGFIALPGFDADGISATRMNNEEMNNEQFIFNLAGQRLNRLQKGINIVNGKKVLVK